MINTIKLAILWIEEQGDTYSNIGHVCTVDNPDTIERVNIDALSPEYFYLTNKRANFFKSNPQLGQYYRIVHGNFFGVGVSQVAIELGLSDVLSEKMPTLLSVFDTLVAKLSTQFEIDFSNTGYTVFQSLKSLVAPYTPYMLNGEKSNVLNVAFNNATQKLQSNTIRQAKNQEIVSAKHPKTPHFLHLINQTYPISNQYREDNSFDKEICGTDSQGNVVNEDVIYKLIELAKNNAGVMYFDVVSVDELHGRNMPIGMQKIQKDPRHWACLPEIIDMLNYAQLKLGVAYITKGGALTHFGQQPPADTPFFSYTNGLLNEIIWMAMSYTTNGAPASPLAAHVRAYDRILCRQQATALVMKGYRLSGFSSGTLRFFVNKDDKAHQAQLSRDLINHNLLPQFSLL
ncbi:hypothetical protein L1D14_25590 [Vibrio tubiashii]|uniref:hypothetical protein n=1 Tax=Vibrio tubiashii TaxID=29498 RepID=UPI001EFDED47|nr:hypothetical protein [Vibrio tubiashii]MCG9579585.1 hypothetical protein [Vibrio tubiashii]